MIHIFRFDYGDGNLYDISIRGNKDEIEAYLKTKSIDVRYIKSKENPARSDKGRRLLPCGQVVACHWRRDKIDNFIHYRQQGEPVVLMWEVNKKNDMERTIEIFNDKEWQPVNFCDLQKGDQFRLFDDGKPVRDKDGRQTWIALGDAFVKGETYVVEVRGIE